MDIQYCKPTADAYLIIESVHTSDAFRVSEIIQVYRKIIGFCNYHQYKYDGKPISGTPSTWQYLQNFFSDGKRITTSPTGKEAAYSVYRGVRNSVRPIANLHYSGMLTKEYRLGAPLSPFTWGEDPIPDIQLYGRSDIHFVMPGNNPPPTAYALYDIQTAQLDEIKDPAAREHLLAKISASTR